MPCWTGSLELFEGYYFCEAQREDFFMRAKRYKDHPTIKRMQELAKELSVVLPISFFEEANNAHFNSVAIIDADGTGLGLYRKSHIPDGPALYRTICWDQWFPEAARAMALQGAEILFYPTAIGSVPQDAGLDSYEPWQAAASDARACWCKFGPTGEIIAAGNDKDEAIIIAQFDLDEIKAKRSISGLFRDRRPDLYKVLLTFDGSKPSS
ncbi:hypothetical protein V6N13_094681 [Hibiscus sabdariffa]